MRPISIGLFALIGLMATAKAGTLYYNSGDNTRGFAIRFGNLSFSSDGTNIIGASGGGYVTLPVTVTGDFQMSFDVYGNSLDVDSNVFFLNAGTAAGIEIRNCPQGTDSPGLFVNSGRHFSDYQGYYVDPVLLGMADATHFRNRHWTHVKITKQDDTLTVNVGGQITTTGLANVQLSPTLDIGLGYYATKYMNGAGRIKYRRIRIWQGTDDFDPDAPVPADGQAMNPNDRWD